jgi:hypothetical protein
VSTRGCTCKESGCAKGYCNYCTVQAVNNDELSDELSWTQTKHYSIAAKPPSSQRCRIQPMCWPEGKMFYGGDDFDEPDIMVSLLDVDCADCQQIIVQAWLRNSHAGS